jgi:hypothetical protein
MSEQENTTPSPMGIPDEALPEDLVPGEDNPLAEGLPPGETAEGLLDPDPDRDPESDSDSDPDRPRPQQTGSAPQEQ